MKRLVLLIILLTSAVPLFSQDNKPTIDGKLKVGEQLDGEFSPGGFVFAISYVWRTATDPGGTLNLTEVGDKKNYRLTTADAGKYIRFEVTVSSFWGQRDTYLSDWHGPVRNERPMILGTVTVSGIVQAGNTVSANFVYDPNNAPESGSAYSWYQAESSTGTNSSLISSAGASLTLTESNIGKYIRIEIIPRDNEGATGDRYTSSWIGPVERNAPANLPPIAMNVRVRGNPVLCGVLTGVYDYIDTENDPQGSSTFRWLRASSTGETPTPIPNATSISYTISADDQNKYIYFEVTPVASSGSTNGTPVLSTPSSLIQSTLPTVTFTGGATICEGVQTNITLTFTGAPPFNLEYTNGSGNFSLATSNTTYQLTVSKGGTYKGIKLTDNLNCPATNLPSSVTIVSKPKPELAFSVENTCYTGDSTFFSNTSPSKASVKTWAWTLGDNASGTKNVSSLEAPKHKYPSAGTYSVQLIAESTDGCKDTLVKSIQLGEKPRADISWDRECLATDKITTFKSISQSKDKISKYAWSLKDATKVLKESGETTLGYTIPALGDYDVKLKITTELACVDSTSRKISVKPVVKITDSAYFDALEKSSSWNIGSATNNNWIWGDPEGTTINAPYSPAHSYYTSFKSPRQTQQLIVSSPCFDFTNVQKPLVELWINYATQPSKEGAVLQYILDGEAAWKNVGDLNSGTNWFNSNAITAKPGDQQTGWTGTSNGWIQARQSIDFLGNKTNVRFRMVYASAADATASDGFAFDDVFIGQRGKKVLLEHFTNLSDEVSNRSNLSVDSIMNSTGGNTVGIQYHTSFPGVDSLNDHNKAHPGARVLYYGVGKVPMTYLDGGPQQNLIYDFTTRRLSLSDVNNRSLEETEFNVKVEYGIAGNTIAGNAKVTASKNIAASQNTLYIAIVEDINVQGEGKVVTLQNVLKYMYPSSSGTVLQSVWTAGQTVEIPFSWTLSNVFNQTKLKVVAFVQNDNTKEVYQVDVANSSTITGNDDAEVVKEKITLYPNPAHRSVTLSLGKELTEEHILQIINPNGKIILQQVVSKGVSLIELSVADFPNGMYYVKLNNKKGQGNTVKLMVNRSFF